MNFTKKAIAFGSVYGIITFLLSPSFTRLISNPNFWNAKEQLLYLTGSIAMVYMVIVMVLSVRISKINDMAGGLDKAYRAHKWIGIFAVVASVIHWLVEKSPKLFIQLGLVSPRKKGPKPQLSEWEETLRSIYKFGNEIAEYALYIMIALIIIALVTYISYKYFRITHKIIPYLFLLVAYHGATIQIKGGWYVSAGCVLLWIMLIAGTAAAFISIFQAIGRKNKVKGTLKTLEYDKSSKIISIKIAVKEGSFQYKPGQFAFLRFAWNKEPHPFSIASYDKDMKGVGFIIKELGDFTRELPLKAKEGEEVILEGAYGDFTFDDDKKRHIWVAGGIGAAPFMAALEYIAAKGGADKKTDFIYSGRGKNKLTELLEIMCVKAGVNFKFNDTSTAGRLNYSKIKEIAGGDINDASLWYCGPSSLIKGIKRDMNASGEQIPLYYDNFEMR